MGDLLWVRKVFSYTPLKRDGPLAERQMKRLCISSAIFEGIARESHVLWYRRMLASLARYNSALDFKTFPCRVTSNCAVVL